MSALFFAALLLGLAAAAAATIIRAFVPQLWLLFKPWSCDLCMSWWCSLALSVLVTVYADLALVIVPILLLASTAVSMTVLKIHNRLSDLGLPPSE